MQYCVLKYVLSFSFTVLFIKNYHLLQNKTNHNNNKNKPLKFFAFVHPLKNSLDFNTPNI